MRIKHLTQYAARFASTFALHVSAPSGDFLSFQAANKSETLSKMLPGDNEAEDAEAARREISALKVGSTLRGVFIVCTNPSPRASKYINETGMMGGTSWG